MSLKYQSQTKILSTSSNTVYKRGKRDKMDDNNKFQLDYYTKYTSPGSYITLPHRTDTLLNCSSVWLAGLHNYSKTRHTTVSLDHCAFCTQNRLHYTYPGSSLCSTESILSHCFLYRSNSQPIIRCIPHNLWGN